MNLTVAWWHLPCVISVHGSGCGSVVVCARQLPVTPHESTKSCPWTEYTGRGARKITSTVAMGCTSQWCSWCALVVRTSSWTQFTLITATHYQSGRRGFRSLLFNLTVTAFLQSPYTLHRQRRGRRCCQSTFADEAAPPLGFAHRTRSTAAHHLTKNRIAERQLVWSTSNPPISFECGQCRRYCGEAIRVRHLRCKSCKRCRWCWHDWLIHGRDDQPRQTDHFR